MDLIESLQNDILEQNTELSSILRKAKVLASKLNNIEIKTWVDLELNGYQNEEELPEYRKFSAFNMGTFNCYDSIRNNIPISVINIPDEKIRNYLNENNIPFGVKNLESTIETGEKELKRPWPAEAICIYNLCNFSQSCTCIAAWRAIPIGQYEQILENIRNRLLEFLLKLQEKYPEIKELSNDTPKIPEREIAQIFNTTILGGQCFIGSNFDNCHIVQQNDLTSLLNYLKKNGVPLTEIDDLKISIQKDENEGKSKEIGENVKKWISNLSRKVLDKTLDVSLDVIKMAIFAYYGIK